MYVDDKKRGIPDNGRSFIWLPFLFEWVYCLRVQMNFIGFDILFTYVVLFYAFLYFLRGFDICLGRLVFCFRYYLYAFWYFFVSLLSYVRVLTFFVAVWHFLRYSSLILYIRLLTFLSVTERWRMTRRINQKSDSLSAPLKLMFSRMSPRASHRRH